jgi:trimeric autotransporter adhesin
MPRAATDRTAMGWCAKGSVRGRKAVDESPPGTETPPAVEAVPRCETDKPPGKPAARRSSRDFLRTKPLPLETEVIRRTLFPAFLVLLTAASPASAAIFTVLNTNPSGIGSLFKAITDANATEAADEIRFGLIGIGNFTINGTLPPITKPLYINGYSQPGSTVNNAITGTNAITRVQLDASDVAGGSALLSVEADNTTIRGVTIRGMVQKAFGIRVTAGTEGTVIDGCYIGTAADGETDDSIGIGIRNDGTDTAIGNGATVAGRNLISGNDAGGIDERGIGTIIANNLIGTDKTTEGYVPNGRGVVVSATADDVLIGGNAVYAKNLIAGNDDEGIDVLPTVAGNVRIENNSYRDNGALAIDLGSDGVTLNDSSDADLGPNHFQNYPGLTFARINMGWVEVEGYLPGQPNTYLFEFYTLETPDPSGFGEGLRRVAILTPTTSGSGFHFRYLIELDGAIVFPLYITATAQNLSTLESSEFSNTLEVLNGGGQFEVTNSNNSGAGSLRAAVESANANPGPDTITFEIPDPAQQIVLQSSLNITEEVIIDGFTQEGAQPNTLATGSNATLKIEVDGSGIASGGTFVINADRVILRGLAINNGKEIGVVYSTGDFGRIEGCYVGTNLTGTVADGNNSHGIFTGVETKGITIGGALASQRNIVSSNNTHGMRLRGDDAMIMGNIVGSDATGTLPLPNGANGISIEGENVSVGHDGLSHTGHNVAAFNVEDGIAVSSSTRGVTILGNSVFENGDLGIDLSVSEEPGVTPNDNDDADDGANRLQNFPEISEVTTTGGSTTVEGTLDVPSGVTDGEYSIRMYSSPNCDESGHGEGKFFQGAQTVVLSGDDESFSVTGSKGVTGETAVVLTATNLDTGDTSEFSACGFLDTTPPLCGDPSDDGTIAAGDALTVLRRAVGTAACPDCVCDVNANGSVTTSDALLVLRSAVGQSVSLSCPPCIIIPGI